jgi:acetolactate synthase-1/2/3 large subunit
VKLSDYVINFVAAQGVRHVFMVPGGGAMHLNDSFGHHPDVVCVSNLHEQASAMAAETYAKATGRLGVALFTTGPGGTNAITGLAGAWLDSTPCLFLSGQVKRPDMKGQSGVRQVGVQEVDIVAVVGPLTKYAVTILEPESIRYHLEKAVHLATSGRPGPVWIDIPLDVQAAPIDETRLEGFSRDTQAPDAPPNASQVQRIAAHLANAERPVLLVGNGIRLAGAQAPMMALVERLGIPVLTTWLAPDLLPYRHPQCIGKPGTVAPRGANFTLQNADLLLSIGSRLDNTITGYAPARLARAATKIMVDIDPTELNKLAPYIDEPVAADASAFITALLPLLGHGPTPAQQAWLARCQEWKRRYPVVLDAHRLPEQPVSTYYLAEVLSDELCEGETIVSGSSGAGIEIFQHALQIKAGQRLFHTTALGAMGYGLPAAIGACLGCNLARTVCVDGDGGIQLNIQELAVLRRLNLPIKLFVLNNNGYSSIRTSQQRWFGRITGADEASGLSLPDITRVAAAFDIPTVRIRDQSNLRGAVRAVLAMDGPVLCEVVSQADETRMPSLMSEQRPDGSLVSKPLEDLWPFLDRDEFLSNMLIPTVED